MRATNRHTLILGLAVALVVTACGSAPQTSTKTSTPTAPTSAVAGNISTYNTKAFNLPFDVTVPTWLSVEPSDEQPNFVTWKATDADRAVRFLIPVNVYPPGGTGTTPPPNDYLAYLLSQTDHGAHFADTTKTTVGGRPATIVTATVDSSLDGSLGCPTQDMAASDCFGLQPDLVLRLAVIDAGDNTLLVWLRNSTSAIDNQTTELDSFERMLTTIRFSDRAVQPPAPATTVVTGPGVATSLDGTYRWTITKDDALAHGTPNDKTPEILASFPSTNTMTMTNGTWALRNPDGYAVGGTYAVDGDRVVFNWDGNVLTFAFTVDGDGTLHLDPQPPMDPGDQFIWATEPWTKIAGAAGAGNTAVATPLDGTYRWTITKDDALAHGSPRDEELPTFPWVFTMTLNAGTWTLRNRAGDGESEEGGTYAVDGNQIAFSGQVEGYTSRYIVSVDDDGTMHLDPQLPIDNPGERFVFATNPWTKIG